MDQKTSKTQKTSAARGGISKNSKITERALTKQSKIDAGRATFTKTSKDSIVVKANNAQLVAQEVKASSKLYAGSKQPRSDRSEKERLQKEAQLAERQKPQEIEKSLALNKGDERKGGR